MPPNKYFTDLTLQPGCPGSIGPVVRGVTFTMSQLASRTCISDAKGTALLISRKEASCSRANGEIPSKLIFSTVPK